MVEKFYTPKQVAEILQIHPYTVLKWIRAGKLKALRFGRVYRTTESELATFLGTTRPQGRVSIEHAHSDSEARLKGDKTETPESPLRKQDVIHQESQSYQPGVTPGSDLQSIGSGQKLSKQDFYNLETQISQTSGQKQ